MKFNFFSSEFAQKSRFHWDFIRNINKLENWEELSENYDSFSKKKNLNKKRMNKIPKIIHQIWIGPRKLPKKYSIWAKTWQELNPTWKYKLWTEIDLKKLTLKNRGLYESSTNYGYKSDLARYEILSKFGGLYIDTDFECLSPIPDNFLDFDFISCIVFSEEPQINNAIMMSKKDSKIIKNMINSIKLLNDFNNPIDIIKSSGAINLTKQYFSLNQNAKKNCLILPSNYFYPLPNFLLNINQDPYEFINPETIGIHHWEMSWIKGGIIERIIKKLINSLNSFRKVIFQKLKLGVKP
tara:strand:- start:2799 stop:3686 length:888 start_codon:yes stop_codon:yes gene_type:complete